MKFNKEKIIPIVGICLLSYLVIIITRGYFIDKSLKENYQITDGKVISWHPYTRGEMIEYQFIVKGKKYKNLSNYRNLSVEKCNELIGQTFKVAYYSRDPNNNKILIYGPDFEFFGIERPLKMEIKWGNCCY